MKTLALLGSPREKGDSMNLFFEMANLLTGEIDTLSAYYDGITPCIDCRHCWEAPGCAIDDGFQRIIRDIDSYDNIVLVSPVYFSELTGQLLAMLSRLQTFWASRFFREFEPIPRKKRGVLILSGGGDGDVRRAEATADTLFTQLNASCAARIYSLETNHVPALSDQRAIKKARDAAILLNALDAASKQ